MAQQPLWYKDAIIYQLHVKAFFDSNNDGIGDFRGPHLEARLHPGPRRHGALAAAVLSLAAQGRRLRHRRLPQRASAVRHARRLQARSCARRSAAGCRVITELVVNHTSDQHPWFQAARRAPQGLAQARLLRVERYRPEVQGHAHHLHRHRDVQLGLGRRGEAVLLAPLLQPPARPQLRQPARAEGGVPHHAVLARHGRRRVPARRDSLPDRARGHQQREPPRDARRAEGDPQRHRPGAIRTRCCSPRRTVARGRAALLRRRRRVPHGVPLPADAAHVHGDRAGGPPSAGRDHGADARHPRHLPVGDLPAQPR